MKDPRKGNDADNFRPIAGIVADTPMTTLKQISYSPVSRKGAKESQREQKVNY